MKLGENKTIPTCALGLASYICCISLFCFVAVYRSFFEGKDIGIHRTHVLYGNIFDAPIKN